MEEALSDPLEADTRLQVPDFFLVDKRVLVNEENVICLEALSAVGVASHAFDQPLNQLEDLMLFLSDISFLSRVEEPVEVELELSRFLFRLLCNFLLED